MTDKRSNETDEALRRLLGDAVAHVRPHDRLGEIRRRTRRSASGPRRWLPVVAGAGVATAAVVGGGGVVLGQLGSEEPTPPLARPAPSPETKATAVYFVDETANGLRLFREFQSLPIADEAGTITQALARVDPAGGPVDPDYDTVWPEGSFADATVEDTEVVVSLGSEEALERPPGASNRDAWIGIQQVVYTAEAAIGEALPVAFEYDGAPAERVLGLPVGALVDRDRQDDVVSPISISDPAEGIVADGEVLIARGTTTSLVDGVDWKFQTADGPGREVAAIVQSSHVTGRPVSSTSVDQGLLVWEARVDISYLAAGEYEFVATVRSLGHTSDDSTLFRDTRTITIP